MYFASLNDLTMHHVNPSVRKYNQVHIDIPEWRIKPEADSSAQDYWKYIFRKHQAEIARMQDLQPADYPPGWDNISLEMAKENLKTLML